MNENMKTYIPYGAAALGAVLGNVLYKKYPKFGTAGRLLAIGIGAVSGYYISDKIVGDDSDDFRNAVGGGCNNRRCEKDCGMWPGKCVGNQCVCFNMETTTGKPIIGNTGGQMTAVRNFSNFANAIGESAGNKEPRACRRHRLGKYICGGALAWDEATCSCVKPIKN